MLQCKLILFLFASLAVAETSKSATVEYFWPGYYASVDPVAEVLFANSSTTVVRASCPTSVNLNKCEWGPNMDFTVISNTIYKASSTQADATMEYSCENNLKQSQMVCFQTIVGGPVSEYQGTFNATLTGTERTIGTATITKGAELLTEGGEASKTTAPISASTSAGPTGSGTPTATAPGGAASTGAAYKFGVEGSGLLALAGAAALNAW